MSLLLACLLDWSLGEPAPALHPVVWIGTYLGLFRSWLPRLPAWAAFVAGTLVWWLGAAAFVGFFVMVRLCWFPLLSWWQVLLLQALLLKPLLSLRLLFREVGDVGKAVGHGLEAGRSQLSRIVSRDTSKLSEGEVRESALESLSENLSDSVVAPLFWFLVFGLPGAALYRFSNTADAMMGYRGRWEWAGKWAALFDDVLSFIPSRLTGLLFWLLAGARRASFSRLRSEAARTPSPNSGWPMAAFALSEGFRFGKPGVYVLNPQGLVPRAESFQRALRSALVAAWVAVLSLSLIEFFLFFLLP